MDPMGIMKIIKRIIGLFTAVTLLLACKNDNKQITSDMIHFPPSGGDKSENAPIMSFDSVICNFGILAVGEKFPHTFHFTNTGNSPLIIAQVSPSCGCTTAKDWPQQPIAPGESGKISVEFNSSGNSGKVDKSITVLTNCIPAVTTLRIQGNVAGVDFIPESKSPIEMEMENLRTNQ
jgi:hypothetical protein